MDWKQQGGPGRPGERRGDAEQEPRLQGQGSHTGRAGRMEQLGLDCEGLQRPGQGLALSPAGFGEPSKTFVFYVSHQRALSKGI